MKELWKATHPRRDATLHIVNRGTPFQPFVVCHNFDGAEWDHGTYCDTLEQAIEAFQAKLLDFGYVDGKEVQNEV